MTARDYFTMTVSGIAAAIGIWFGITLTCLISPFLCGGLGP